MKIIKFSNFILLLLTICPHHPSDGEDMLLAKTKTKFENFHFHQFIKNL